jgi:hypothetical protein
MNTTTKMPAGSITELRALPVQQISGQLPAKLHNFSLVAVFFFPHLLFQIFNLLLHLQEPASIPQDKVHGIEIEPHVFMEVAYEFEFFYFSYTQPLSAVRQLETSDQFLPLALQNKLNRYARQKRGRPVLKMGFRRT